MFNAPQAQWNDRVGQAAEYTNLSFGGRLSGPIVMDKDFYNMSFQFDRRSQDLPTLLSTAPVLFQSAGIATDSVTRFRSVLGRIGVPSSARGLGSSSPRTTASVLGSLDWAPKSPTSGQAFNIAYNGSWNSAGPQGTSLWTQTPGSLSSSASMSGGVQLRHTNYFGKGVLTESNVSVTGSRSHSDPYLELPSGSVLVTSKLDDGSTSTRSLGFGGGANASANNTAAVTARNVLSWFSDNNKHRIKLISELRADRTNSEQAFNLRGRYTYQSLADLDAGRPSSFSRSLNAVDRTGSALVGALALGDAWRPNKDVQVQLGVRVDGNYFLTKPTENAVVQNAFGASNTNVPNGVYVSPRIGFSWLYGTASQIPYADGFFTGPRATVRGGIGVFQNMRGPDLVTSAIANTGLPGSALQLSCTGTATPTSEWNVLSASGAPTRCADGSAGSVFSNSAPNVTVFDSRYAQEKSIRTNLSWTGNILQNRFALTANGTYSYNMHQPDAFDLNFRGAQQFALPAEGGRPVYVLPTSIDPVSGLIGTRDARVSLLFSTVSSQRSDLHSHSQQLSLSLSPFTISTPKIRWTASYAYLRLQQQFRGFSSTTGNPFTIESGIGSGPMHDFAYSLSYNVRNAITFTWGGRLTSGSRFTPTIAGDVNGDGSRNDRAFVFDPSTVSDATLAASMKSLLDNGSSAARDCLARQLGTFAKRNSCVAPWTTGNTTLRMVLNPVRMRLPQRTTISFTMSNPIGAADLLLHGQDRLRGWGQTPFVDQSLLFVRGFDPLTSRYRYDVNQRFGSTSASQTTTRTPVVLTMQVSYDLSPTRDWQNLRQQLDRGRSRAGAKMTEAQVRQMSSNFFPNPMASMLQSMEALHLTRKQADSLATMSRRYTRLVDSLWTPSAKALAALPKDYDRTAAQARLVAAREVAVGYLITAVPHVRTMLTKGQYRVLPTFVANMLEPRYLELLRSGQTGGEFGFFFF